MERAGMKLAVFLTTLFLAMYGTERTDSSNANKRSLDLTARINFLKFASFELSTVHNTLQLTSAHNRLKTAKPNSMQWEAYQQTMTALMVQDIGGGALVPGIEFMIEEFETGGIFHRLVPKFKEYNNMVGNIGSNSNILEGAKNIRKTIFKEFDNIVKNTPLAQAALSKTKKLLKLKTIGKVIGPLFDIVGIGIDIWVLTSTTKACVAKPRDCNPGSIVSSTLGILAGLVGVGTAIITVFKLTSFGAAIGPIGALLGLTLGIAATLIDILWKGPVKERVENKKLMRTLMGKDSISDLVHLYKKLGNANNATLWAAYSKYLFIGKKNDNDNGIMKRKFGKDPAVLDLTNDDEELWFRVDPSLEDINMLNSTSRQRFDETATEWLRMYRHGQKRFSKDNVLIINYDHYEYEKEIFAEKNKDWKSRGLDITGGDGCDTIIIGRMSHMCKTCNITIDLKGGNDSVNIDGLFGFGENKVNIDLGTSGHNVLNFMGVRMDRTLGGDNGKLNAWGIKLEQGGKLGFFHMVLKDGDKHRPAGVQENYGFIKNVRTLLASTGMDKIYLTSNSDVQWELAKDGENAFDFTVYKARGASLYVIDVFDEIKFYNEYGRPRQYKVVDKTYNHVVKGHDGKCKDVLDLNKEPYLMYQHPRILIKNLQADFVTNDILLKDNHIYIYANTKNDPAKSEKSYNKNTDFGKEADDCNEESGDGDKKGGEDYKHLVAIISIKARCDYVVKGVSAQNQCLLSRWKNDLDIIFCEGKLKTSVSNQEITGTGVLILTCSENDTSTTNGKIKGFTTLMITNDEFLEPCIDKDKGGKLSFNPSSKELVIEDGSSKWEFTLGDSINAIINEFSGTLWDENMSDKVMDLRSVYIDVTGRKGKEEVAKLSDGIAKDMSVCMDTEDRNKTLNLLGLTPEACDN